MPLGYDSNAPKSITCLSCGLILRPKKKKQKFCSSKCKIRYWKFNHLEKRNFWDKRWQRNDYKKNPRKWLEKTFKRERLKVKSNFRLTQKGWDEIKARYDYRCAGCGKSEREIKLTVDHIFPLAKGGQHVYENIQPLCRSCNSRKGTNLIKV